MGSKLSISEVGNLMGNGSKGSSTEMTRWNSKMELLVTEKNEEKKSFLEKESILNELRSQS